MDQENEFRRQQLKRLVDSFGRGGVTLLAGKLGIYPTYLSRMLSDPQTKQHRAITGDTVIALTKLYPDWLSPANATPEEQATLADQPGARYSTELDRLISRLKEAQSNAEDFPAVCKAINSVLDLAMKRHRPSRSTEKSGKGDKLTLAKNQTSFYETVASLKGGKIPNKNSK